VKAYRKIKVLKTQERMEVIDITQDVEEALEEAGCKEGFVLVFAQHTSVGVYISDVDRNLQVDWVNLGEKIIPQDEEYLHNHADPKRNAEAHLKGIVTGLSVIVPVSEGRLDLGVYQRIYYVDYDGGREKEILIKIYGE